MLETNLRIVRPGSSLTMAVRKASVRGTATSPDLLHRACGRLLHSRGLPAVPVWSPEPSLLIVTQQQIGPLELEDEEWALQICDAGEAPRVLTLAAGDGDLMEALLERAVQAAVYAKTDLWTLDSPRMFYNSTPSTTADGIAAYRRFEIGTHALGDAGLAVAVDVGTTFFTTDHLAWFLEEALPADERRRRSERLTRITGRQGDQKGTLLYDNSQRRVKCYLERTPVGVTCENTGMVKARGKTFPSLMDYYRHALPVLGDCAGIRAVQVSFRGLERPVWVRADRLRVRVMNDNLPPRLTQTDKVPPAERRGMVEAFWASLGSRPLDGLGGDVSPEPWKPDAKRVVYLPSPALVFGAGACLPPPSGSSPGTMRQHYQDRGRILRSAGVFALPSTASRDLFCAYPRQTQPAAAEALVTDVAHVLKDLSGREFSFVPVPYAAITDAVSQLRRAATGGTVLLVLDDRPESYYNAAFELGDWRIKRVTSRTLAQQYRPPVPEAHTDEGPEANGSPQTRGWDQFVWMTALDLLQQMDGLPWRISDMGAYDAMLTIDVGHDRRYVAASILLARTATIAPSFQISSKVYAKPDTKQEAINGVLLADHLTELVEEVLGERGAPLRSLLVLRDGRTVGDELVGIHSAREKLQATGRLGGSAPVDVVDVHKGSLKPLRFWQVDQNGRVTNPVEGTAVLLNETTVAMACTGAATLRQGTAKPLLLCRRDGRADMLGVAAAVFGAAQLNWSSPGVAQRLPLPLKRTDEELSVRASQEVRRVS